MSERYMPIGDFVPELTGVTQPSRLISMQDNGPENSSGGGTIAIADRAGSVVEEGLFGPDIQNPFTQTIDQIENKFVRDHIEGLEKRLQEGEAAGDLSIEDLQNEYKKLQRFSLSLQNQGLMAPNSERAISSRKERIIDLIREKGMEGDEVVNYLFNVDQEIQHDIAAERQRAARERKIAELNDLIRAEKGYASDVQIGPAEQAEFIASHQNVQQNNQNPQNETQKAESEQAGGRATRVLDMLDEQYTAYVAQMEREGKEPNPRERWEIFNRLRRAEGLQSIRREVIDANVNINKFPDQKDAIQFQQEVEKSYQDRFGGRVPHNMQDWMQWVVDVQGDRYGPSGEVPLWREFNGKRIIQPQNVLEWFREQMMRHDSQAGDENEVNFWAVGVPLKAGGQSIPIQTFQNLAKSFFLDEVTGVVLDKLLDSMVLEVWQANAARHLFQINDLLKESDTQFFEQYGKAVASNYLTKPGAIEYFALSGVSPDKVYTEEDLLKFIENDQQFDNQQTGVAIRAALITYGYLGDIETLVDLWGKDSAFFNNKEFVRSYFAAQWSDRKHSEVEQQAKDRYAKLLDESKREISLEEYVAKAIDDAKLEIINTGRRVILLDKAKNSNLEDIDENPYNESIPELKDQQGPDNDLKKPFDISQFFDKEGNLIDPQQYTRHLINIYREATPYPQIIDEIKARITYSLTAGGKQSAEVENPDYNPRLPNGELTHPDKKEDDRKMVTQFDPVSLTSAIYGVRNAQYQDANWMHMQDPTGRGQRAGAKISRRVRNSVRATEPSRLGTPGNIEAINTMRVLGLGLFEGAVDEKKYTMAERIRGSDLGWVNINLRRKMDSTIVQYEKDKSKAFQADFFKRGVALWEQFQKGSLFSGLSEVAKRDFFQGIIVNHHKLDELIHDGIGKNIQYFVSTQSSIDYSKYVRDRDETAAGKYRTISNAERFYGYDVLNRDKYHMIIADRAYLDHKWKQFTDHAVKQRRDHNLPPLSDAELYDEVSKRMASLPRNLEGEVVIRGHEREKWGVKKVIIEEVKEHGHPKKNAYGQTLTIEKNAIDPYLVEHVDRNLLWKEVLKAEIVNSLIEHRKRGTGHERFDWEVSQTILDLLGSIPARAELDPFTGKYHPHTTLFSKEDIEWIQKHALMGHLLMGELQKEGAKELAGALVDFFSGLISHAMK